MTIMFSSSEVASLSDFDKRMSIAFVGSVVTTIIAGLLIVSLLIQIELNKTSMFLEDGEEDADGNSKPSHSLDLSVESPTNSSSSSISSSSNGGNTVAVLPVVDGLETEQDPAALPHQGKVSSPLSRDTLQKSITQKTKIRRTRRVPFSFKVIQLLSVATLILLTYLLLVVSSAPFWISTIGAFAVLGMFFRYQVGEELRRQRLDRLVTITSLFLLIAASLSMSTYASKSLVQGEIYEGPARIVGYDYSSYSNAEDAPVRTDLMVSWGSSWGCPQTGNKVCSADVHGAMCEADEPVAATQVDAAADATDNGGTRRQRRTRQMADSTQKKTATEAPVQGQAGKQDLEQDLEEEEDANQDLEQENEDLEKENEELEDEVEEMQEEEQEEEEEAEEEEEIDEDEMVEIEDEYDEVLVEEDAEIIELSEDLEEVEEEEVYDEEVIKEATQGDSSGKDTTSGNLEEEAKAEEKEAEAEEAVTEANEEAEREYDSEENDYDVEVAEYVEEEEAEVESYWDEETGYTFDDDIYDSAYWDYDWSTVWGEYGCTDLFETDMEGYHYDSSVPPGGTDDWPFINIYGSCKTCDAYILDYFAEDAFERVEGIRKQAVFYFSCSVWGLGTAFLLYLKFHANPAAENEIELLSNDGGVLA